MYNLLMRWLSLLLLIFAAGCGMTGSGGKGKIVLRIATWGGAEDTDSDLGKTVRGLWDEFERENPGIEIREEKIPGSKEYVSKMLLSYVAGTEPDIMSLDASSTAIFIENKVLADLQPIADKDPDFNLSDYWENAVAFARRGSHLYAIPADFTPMVVYYNKRLFDAAGIPYPKDDWNYTDFLETAKRLTDPAKGQWGFKFDNWMPGWIIWVWNMGGDVLSPDGKHASGYLDGPRTIAALEWMNRMINVEKVAPSLSQVAALGVNPFMDGKAGMEVAGHWEMVGIKAAKNIKLEDIGVAPWPSDIGKPNTVLYAVGFAMSRRTKHPDAAWKFIKFLASKRYQERYQTTGIAVCGRKDVALERAKGDSLEQKFLEIVPSARPPWGAFVEGYDYVETEGPKMMDRILAGGDAKKEAEEAVRRIDGYFKIR
jgi:multiple sugar transport system substrate-binding protein